MGQPVTTNPLIIMCINLTIVFAVLFGLSLVIRLIHAVDPTRVKKSTASVPEAKAVAVPAATEVHPEPASVQEGVSPEIIAAISAAVAAYGGSGFQIRSVRPLPQNAWRQAARLEGKS